MPSRETPPFSLTFKVRLPLSLLLSWAFSARRRSNEIVEFPNRYELSQVKGKFGGCFMD